MIDARSLHGWLGVGRDFSNWFRKLTSDYGFQEGADYSPVSADNARKRGKPRKDYLLTPSVAKEVAMIGNTPAGRATHRYSVDVERSANQMATAPTAGAINAHPWSWGHFR